MLRDPGCLSRIPDPGSWFLPIPDPGSWIPDPGSKNSNKREGEKKNFCHTFFCSHKFHKIENYFIFDMLNKKIWPNFPRIIEVFTQKIVTKPSKIWVWDPGSRIQGSKRHRIPDGSRIRIRNTGLIHPPPPPHTNKPGRWRSPSPSGAGEGVDRGGFVLLTQIIE